MKNILTTAIVSTALVGGAAMAATPGTADMKIGIVDYLKVYQDVPQGAKSLENLKAQLQPKVEELQKNQQALAAKLDTFNKNAATMTKEDVAAKQKTFTEEQQSFQQQVMQVRQDEMKKEQALAEVFQTTLNNAITSVGKDGSYTVILNSQAVPYTSFKTGVVDATAAVVKIMNTDAK